MKQDRGSLAEKRSLTDRQMDTQTDTPSYREVLSHLKMSNNKNGKKITKKEKRHQAVIK